MSRRYKLKTRKAGLSPGTLPEETSSQSDCSGVSLIHYGPSSFVEKEISHMDECASFKESPGITWINVEGVHQIQVIQKLGEIFQLHPLLLEDITCGEQRPKVDDYEAHLFIVIKMLHYAQDKKEIMSEQVSFVLGKNYVLSFQEGGFKGDVFNPNRERIRTNKGRVRKAGADYLLYSLIDTVVDNYFIILEKLGEQLEEMEIELISNPSPPLLHSIYHLKREAIFLRKAVWPLREVISKLERDDYDLIQTETQIFIRDVYDHTIQVIETIESYRDITAGMLDIYLSSVSNRMNSIMKILTIISTIFIPLTFIVGVYGMNFKYLPELDWKYSYPAVWLVMLSITGLMILYFRRKKWL